MYKKQLIILILLVIFILLRYLFINKEYQKIADRKTVHFPYQVRIKNYLDTKKCLLSYLSLSFEIGDCLDLEEGKELEIYGTFDNSNDRQFFYNKRLIISKIVEDRTHLYSVNNWFYKQINSLIYYFQTLKLKFQAELGEEDGALIIGFILSNPKILLPKTRLLFESNGLSYLLHTSGTISLLFFEFLTSFLPLHSPKFKYLFLFFFSGLYFVTSGFTSSLTRPCTYYFLQIVASIFFKRPFLPLYGLAISLLIILCIYPLYLLDFGFQVSFVAAFSISLYQAIFPRSREKSRTLIKSLKGILESILLPLIFIQAFTLPWVFLQTAQINLWSLISGVCLSPWVSSLTVMGFMYVLISQIPGLSFLFTSYIGITAQAILSQLHFWIGLPSYQTQLSYFLRALIVLNWYVLIVIFIKDKAKRKEQLTTYEVV